MFSIILCNSIMHWLRAQFPFSVAVTALLWLASIVKLLTVNWQTLLGVRDGKHTTGTSRTFQRLTARRLAKVETPLQPIPHCLQTCRRRRTPPGQHPSLLLRRGSRRRAHLCQFSRKCPDGVHKRDPELSGSFKIRQSISPQGIT